MYVCVSGVGKRRRVGKGTGALAKALRTFSARYLVT